MALLLGIDLGTSYFKVGVFDAAGVLCGLGRVMVEKDSPQPGWQEMPVNRFWSLLRAATDDALRQAGAEPKDIAGISYSSQANTFVLLDAAGSPLTPLIFWTDTRGGAVPEPWADFSRTEAFGRTIGFEGLSAESAVVKWHWLRTRQPQLWARARWTFTIADYLTFALTGEPLGDASTAALLGLYDLHRGGWWPAALAAYELDVRTLATPLRPASPAGRTLPAAADLLGLRAGMAFAVGALDHHAAALGSGVGEFADASISTGTVLAALRIVRHVEPRPHCLHGPDLEAPGFYRLAFDVNGAGQLDRFQREFAPERNVGELIAEAAALAPGSRPDASPWSPAWGASRAAAMRQLLESIAVAHRRLLETVADGQSPGRISATGGGARSTEWLAIMADLLRVPIVTPACPERACLGAATFAAAAAGIHRSPAAARHAMVRPHHEFRPDPARATEYRRFWPE